VTSASGEEDIGSRRWANMSRRRGGHHVEEAVMEPVTRRVVVGVDGSPGARAALAWALPEAASRGATVEVLSAFPVDVYWLDPLLLDTSRIHAARARTAALAEVVVDEVRRDPAVAAHPGVADLDVGVHVVAMPPAPKLVRLSEGADLLVVGSRGRGALRGALCGSVALHCAAHARCPVVVVHPVIGPEEAPPRVVVGLEESTHGRAALAAAVAQAARIGARVDAIVAYRAPQYWAEPLSEIAPSPEEIRQLALETGQRVVAETGGRVDAVRVRAVEGHPAKVLVRESFGARLLVVGSRSRNPLEGLALGSVALGCLTGAPCPVVVVRTRAGGPERAETLVASTAAAMAE
jgi:nucleotide-binding universal stress UspA family protein